jgi:hypothetical protein
VPPEREIFPSLTVEENPAVAALPGGPGADLRVVPDAGGAPPRDRQPAIGRRRCRRPRALSGRPKLLLLVLIPLSTA